jgi:hypothetical protein
MSASPRPRRAGLVWAVIGGLILVGGIAALVLNMSIGNGEQPEPAPTPTTSLSPNSPVPFPSPEPTSDAVDPSVAASGWVPEPVTTDAEEYIRAALAAASTFDTTRASRDDWLGYLDTWFTPDTRYSEHDRDARMDAARLELRQGVVLPHEIWDSLAAQDGRVMSVATGEVVILPVPEDPSGDMRIGTSDVEMTFTQTDGTGAESSYLETVRVSAQVLCGPESVPAPDSPQQAGDCKVVRFFTEPVEE